MLHPKIIARYLPQFHQIPENDMWWGKGFTEWTTVRKAEALFSGHQQPQHPLKDYYYNLLDKSTMLWQASLAQKYGIDGFAFYHYWLENGERVLEKPAENLLRWQDIDMPFCFCWANQTWARTWSKFWGANSWNSVCETQNKEKEILLKQRYGLTKEWEKHINYLIPFFRDDRYIKYEGRPVFIILDPDEHMVSMCMHDMLEVWNNILEENGIKRLYMIAEKKYVISLGEPAYDIEMLRFPDVLFNQLAEAEKNGTKIFCYQEYVDKMESLARSAMDRGDLVCVADAWDNTPRYGTDGSVIFQGEENYFDRWWPSVMNKAAKEKLPFVFYNAWNEWGEGMFLEPSKEKGFYYLEKIKKTYCTDFVEEDDNISSSEHYDFPLREKEQGIPQGLVEKWMNLRDEQRSIADYLKRNEIYKVAIYGIGMFGRHLTKELMKSNIEIVCLLDKNTDVYSYGLPIYSTVSKCPEVDLIIITPFGFYETIRKDLKRDCSYPTCSLEYIIDDMLLELQV